MILRTSIALIASFKVKPGAMIIASSDISGLHGFYE